MPPKSPQGEPKGRVNVLLVKEILIMGLYCSVSEGKDLFAFGKRAFFNWSTTEGRTRSDMKIHIRGSYCLGLGPQV